MRCQLGKIVDNWGRQSIKAVCAPPACCGYPGVEEGHLEDNRLIDCTRDNLKNRYKEGTISRKHTPSTRVTLHQIVVLIHNGGVVIRVKRGHRQRGHQRMSEKQEERHRMKKKVEDKKTMAKHQKEDRRLLDGRIVERFEQIVSSTYKHPVNSFYPSSGGEQSPFYKLFNQQHQC